MYKIPPWYILLAMLLPLLLLGTLIGARVIPREHKLAYEPAIIQGAMTLVFAHCGVNMIPQEPDQDDKVALV